MSIIRDESYSKEPIVKTNDCKKLINKMIVKNFDVFVYER